MHQCYKLPLHTGQNESKRESCSVESDSLCPQGLYSPCNSPGENTGVGSLSLFQGIFPTQESNSGLPHCRWIVYQLSHKGSPSQNGHHQKVYNECCKGCGKKRTRLCCWWECKSMQPLWKPVQRFL